MTEPIAADSPLGAATLALIRHERIEAGIGLHPDLEVAFQLRQVERAKIVLAALAELPQYVSNAGTPGAVTDGGQPSPRVLTREEATTVERPPFPAPYRWPEPVLVAVSNVATILPEPQSLPNGDPLEYALARLMIETLYDNGWVLAKVVPAPG
jgi:hypothetical protein